MTSSSYATPAPNVPIRNVAELADCDAAPQPATQQPATQQPATPPAVAGLKLSDLMADPVRGPVVRGSFAIVKLDATLADARRAMDKATTALNHAGSYYDVFVTPSGSVDEAVVGWITNDIINDNAKV